MKIESFSNIGWKVTKYPFDVWDFFFVPHYVKVAIYLSFYCKYVGFKTPKLGSTWDKYSEGCHLFQGSPFILQYSFMLVISDTFDSQKAIFPFRFWLLIFSVISTEPNLSLEDGISTEKSHYSCSIPLSSTV